MSSRASGIRKEDQPAHASRRVKCTYQECFRYFSNEKDMKAHKKKEPSHEYCHKCDVDCEDDSDLLIHMIESGKHSKRLTGFFFRPTLTFASQVVCPMCGMEFKSNAGLEAHIPQATYQPLIDCHEI
jgi:Zinc finger, C2H2 type